MSGTPCQRTEIEDLVAAYRSDLLAASQFAEHPVTSVARTFLAGVVCRNTLSVVRIAPLRPRWG